MVINVPEIPLTLSPYVYNLACFNPGQQPSLSQLPLPQAVVCRHTLITHAPPSITTMIAFPFLALLALTTSARAYFLMSGQYFEYPYSHFFADR